MMGVLLEPQLWTVVGPGCEPPPRPVGRPRKGKRWWTPPPVRGVPRLELLMVLRGRGSHRYRGRVHEFWPGVVFCYGPHERRETEWPTWVEGLEFLWVHASPRALTAHLGRCVASERGHRRRATTLLLVDEVGPTGRNPLLDLGFVTDLPEPARPLVVRAGVELLVARILELGYRPPDWREIPLRRQAMRVVADFIDYVGGQTDVAECARLAGCSDIYLIGQFPRYHGRHLKPYIDECRLAEVGRLLVHEGWQKQEVAAHFGISPAAFSSWLKRMQW